MAFIASRGGWSALLIRVLWEQSRMQDRGFSILEVTWVSRAQDDLLYDNCTRWLSLRCFSSITLAI